VVNAYTKFHQDYRVEAKSLKCFKDKQNLMIKGLMDFWEVYWYLICVL